MGGGGGGGRDMCLYVGNQDELFVNFSGIVNKNM